MQQCWCIWRRVRYVGAVTLQPDLLWWLENLAAVRCAALWNCIGLLLMLQALCHTEIGSGSSFRWFLLTNSESVGRMLEWREAPADVGISAGVASGAWGRSQGSFRGPNSW